MPQSCLLFLGPPSGWHAVQATVGSSARLTQVEPRPEALAAALADADGLIDAAIRVRLTDDMVRGAPRLKVVSCASTGTDHVARGEIDKRRIVVRSLFDSPEVI